MGRVSTKSRKRRGKENADYAEEKGIHQSRRMKRKKNRRIRKRKRKVQKKEIRGIEN